MGLIAAGVGAAVGIGAAVINYATTDRSVYNYNYGKAEDALDDYMGNVSSMYGNIGSVSAGQATYNSVDPMKTGNQAVNFNLQQMGNYQNMASQINSGALDDRLAMLEKVSPDWQEQRDLSAAANTAMIKGEIPLDVQQQMARTNAYSTFQNGYSGSPSTRQGALARDLGLTSLALTSIGQENAQSWLKTNSEIAMPEQTTAGDIMNHIGFTSELTTNTALSNEQAKTSTQLANIGNTLEADKFNVTSQLAAASGMQSAYGTELEVLLKLESQKQQDLVSARDQKNATNSALWSGIGNSVGSAAGAYMGGM